uniref:Reverse transcriptase/retrotransposon-derived protein RNase H-like domain-containing protein n=1 Tax=Lactuca sativa TaxID=4236 RepID=A0A9R1UHJ7_LACSA|nr:hypothetical protein LSAT_V11C900462460 [Lactuca sativa]
MFIHKCRYTSKMHLQGRRGQFLGYYLEEIPSPNTLRGTQRLNGKLTTLNRFISKAAEKAIPLFHTLKGCIEKNNFRWTPDAESALQEIKKALHTLPTLANPVPGETMQVYLSASKDAILSVLVVEWQGRQLPIYFTSSAHQIEVLTSCPIKQVLLKPKTSVRLAKWAIELGEHDISYHPRISIKGQALVDFLLEIWTLYTDEASSKEGSCVGLILTSPTGEEITYALRFDFYTSNNKADYEALLAGLRLEIKWERKGS